MTRDADADRVGDVRAARGLFPVTSTTAYFNTAAVGLASQALQAAYHQYVDDWAQTGLDYGRGEAAGESARTAGANLIGAERSDVALIASVSAAAGLVAAHGPVTDGVAFRQLDQTSTAARSCPCRWLTPSRRTSWAS